MLSSPFAWHTELFPTPPLAHEHCLPNRSETPSTLFPVAIVPKIVGDMIGVPYIGFMEWLRISHLSQVCLPLIYLNAPHTAAGCCPGRYHLQLPDEPSNSILFSSQEL